MSTNRLQIALNFARALSSVVNTKAVLSGGCARDVYFGREPKDFDIIIPLQADIEAVSKLLNYFGLPHKVLHFYRDDLETDRISSCIKVLYQGVEFDVIQYQVTDVMDSPKFFDFNLNQFILDIDGRPMFVGSVHPNEGLVEIRGDASQRRKDYIQAKYREIYGTH